MSTSPTTKRKYWRVIDLSSSKIVFIAPDDWGLRVCLEKGYQRYTIQFSWEELQAQIAETKLKVFHP